MMKKNKQMSESLLTASMLSISGGLQDVYTYISRGHVFANAQTGNIVLLSQLFGQIAGRVRQNDKLFHSSSSFHAHLFDAANPLLMPFMQQPTIS